MAWNAGHSRAGSGQRLYEDALQLLTHPDNRGDAAKGREAVAMLQRAVEANPTNGHYLNALSNGLFDAGQAEASLAASVQSVQVNPQVAISHETLAQGLLDNGKPEEALAAVRRAAEMDLHTDPASSFHNPLNRMISASRSAGLSGALEAEVRAFAAGIGLAPLLKL